MGTPNGIAKESVEISKIQAIIQEKAAEINADENLDVDDLDLAATRAFTTLG